jgi:hypothetical protein
MATPLPSSSLTSTHAHKRARLSGDATVASSDESVPLLRRASTSLASSATSSSESDQPSSASVASASVAEATSNDREKDDSETTLVRRAEQMADRAARGEPLTEEEINGVVQSIQNLSGESEGKNDSVFSFDTGRLRGLLGSSAHLSHKDWSVTEANADELLNILFPSPHSSSKRGDSTTFDDMAPVVLERIMTDGNWMAAETHALPSKTGNSAAGSGAAPNDKPWAVLVTGVNGIRKTTSMYQPWFPQVLEEALVVPSGLQDGDVKAQPSARELLPTGQNSFFRQLDHMIATLCNREFEMLYRMTEKECQALQVKDDADGSVAEVPPDAIERYTNLKAAIFSRYRTLSELLGALLLKQARKRCMNCLMETSGKDIAMFQYVDHFLPDYNKLALRFQINQLDLAKTSVDERMKSEILAGMQAHTVQQVIRSNQGGPYGSQVLPDIQRDSDAVWHNQVATNRGVGNDWYKATIQIVAHPDRPWTAQAVRPDGTLGTLHEFLPKEE